MTIFFDVLNDTIFFLDKEKLLFKKEYDYSLGVFENKLKAINELKFVDEVTFFNNEKDNILILPDDLIGYGSFKTPSINRKKGKDIFLTKFRLAFPNFKDYYVDSFELSRTSENVSFVYAFVKIEYVNLLINAFKELGLNIGVTTNLTNFFVGNGKVHNPFPQIYLIVGSGNTELFIVKDEKILCSNFFGFGEKNLENSDKYLYSLYNLDNKEALCFSSYLKNNKMISKNVSDDQIMVSESVDGLKIVEPKQLRLLKENSLKQYLIKENYRKFYSRIEDALSYYSGSPWFIPVNNVRMICSNEVYEKIDEINKVDNTFKIEHILPSLAIINKPKILSNPLFNQTIKNERKKIDWKALLTTDIGKKKKA